MTDTTVLPARPKQLLEMRLMRPMQEWNNWCVKLPAGHTLDDMARPEYWAHVWRKLREFDRIEVVAEDHSCDADLRVVSVRPNEVVVRALRVWLADEADDRPSGDEADEALPRVQFVPHHEHRWRVLGLDGSVAAKGFATKAAALDEMARLFPGRRRAA